MTTIYLPFNPRSNLSTPEPPVGIGHGTGARSCPPAAASQARSASLDVGALWASGPGLPARPRPPPATSPRSRGAFQGASRAKQVTRQGEVAQVQHGAGKDWGHKARPTECRRRPHWRRPSPPAPPKATDPVPMGQRRVSTESGQDRAAKRQRAAPASRSAPVPATEPR